MTTELCDFCGVNLNSRIVSACSGQTLHLKISKLPPYKEEVGLTLCSRCHEELLSTISKNSRKEWKQEAKTQLRELFP